MHVGRRRAGRVKGSMEGYEGKKRGVLTTGNGATHSARCRTISKRGLSGMGIGHKRFGNSGSVLT